MATNDYKKQSLISVKWSYAGSLVPKIISPIIFFLLARWLSPKDFGLIAVAYLVISLVEMSREAGTSRAIIQSDLDEKTIFSISFVVNCILGIVSFTILFATAPLIAKFFQSSESSAILRILGIQILLSSLSLSYQSIIKKRIDFKKLFFINMIPSATQIFITFPLAYFGFGVWSIVYGQLAASFLRTISFLIALPWVPQIRIDYKKTKQLLRFGVYCYLEAMLGWVYLWGDKAILGKFVTTSSLGNYMLAFHATSNIGNASIFPLSQVVYPYLCKEKNSQNFRPFIYRLLSYFSIVSLFMGLVLFHVASILPQLLDEKWAGIVFPFAVLSISTTFSMIFTYIIPDAIKAVGKPEILFRFQLIKLIYTLPIFVLSAYLKGVNGFCIAKLITVIIGCLLFCWLGVNYLELNYRSIFHSLKNPFCSFLGTFVLLIWLKQSILIDVPAIFAFVILLGIGFSVYFCFLLIIDRQLIKDFVMLCIRVIPKPMSTNP